MPRNESVGPRSSALRGVVVDDVEDHLDAGVVKVLDQGLELGQRVAGHVARLRGEEAQRVVAPVVVEAAFHQRRLVEVGVDGQQLDRRDAQRAQVPHDRG